jgi:serine/threonine protein kinase
MRNTKNNNPENEQNNPASNVSPATASQKNHTSRQTQLNTAPPAKLIARPEMNDPDTWVKGVKFVENNPRGFREIAFVRKVKSRNFVVLEEVLYQAQGENDSSTYWAKSVRESEKERRTINPQAQIARYLRQFDIKGIWEAKHYLEIQGKHDKSYKMILSEKLPPGRTLFQLIYDEGKNGLKEEKALHIIRNLTQTVQKLHGAGVYHWDISAKNIWVTDAGEPILFDWDFAFISKEEFLERKLWRCGTPHYLSRERLDAMEMAYETSECTLRTDSFSSHEVYSLISVLAHMLLGNEFLKYGTHFGIPFNEHESLGQVLKERNREADGISPWLREILAETFISGKSPFETADDFITALTPQANR